MGNSSSQEIKNSITNNTNYSQKIINELKTDIQNSSDSLTFQSISIMNGSKDVCDNAANAQILCNMNIGQTVDIKTQFVNKVDAQTIQKMTSELKDTANAQLDSILDSIQKGDAIADNVNQTIKNNVKNTINETITEDNITSLIEKNLSKTDNTQKLEIVNCGIFGKEGQDCNINQDVAISIIANNMVSSFADQLSQAQSVIDLATKVVDSEKSEQSGLLSSILDSFEDYFKNIGLVGLLIFVGVGIFIFIIIIFLVYLIFFRKKTPQNIPPNMQYYIKTPQNIKYQ